jgi:MFS family permease
MSAFAAGTALGPALGGVLVDQLGINPTFYLVGVSYVVLAGVNSALLDETKPQRTVSFPWQGLPGGGPTAETPHRASMGEAFHTALGQWVPLLSEAPVRNVCIMNAFYWVALAGSQMTLLPLILTNPEGLAMTATQVGQVYMVRTFSTALVTFFAWFVCPCTRVLIGLLADSHFSCHSHPTIL